MRALRHYAPPPQHNNMISPADLRQPVSDQQRRAPARRGPNRPLNFVFGRAVDCAVLSSRINIGGSVWKARASAAAAVARR